MLLHCFLEICVYVIATVFQCCSLVLLSCCISAVQQFAKIKKMLLSVQYLMVVHLLLKCCWYDNQDLLKLILQCCFSAASMLLLLYARIYRPRLILDVCCADQLEAYARERRHYVALSGHGHRSSRRMLHFQNEGGR